MSHQLSIGTLYYEGQGNNGAEYTCGPAATRNLVKNMTGSDYGENQFAVWENMSSSTGTAITAIRDTLNNHFKSWGSWSVAAPTSATDLIADVEADTYYAAHPQMLTQNVDTADLPNWGGHYAKHYDSLYGYSTSSSSVDLAEEWNHIENGVQPYGFHVIAANTDYKAVHDSPSTEVVY